MKIIVGLGNPGMEYVKTRHNVGFEVINVFAKRHNAKFSASQQRAFIAEMNLKGEKLILVKPVTFMNASGDAVGPIMRRFRAEIADLIVVYDDMDLEIGKLRMRESGSAGGHNGMKSIISCCGTQEFCRLRIGIGHRGTAVNHVLSRFNKEESPIMEQAFETAADALEDWIEQGSSYVMNHYN